MIEIPVSMTAAFIRRLGGVEEIEVGRLPVPRCGPDDVLAKVEALAVNHVDTFVRSGSYATELPMPFIIGRDFVGCVVATGNRVTSVTPGDRVWCNSLGYDGRQGAFADYALAPASRVYPLPPNQDPLAVVSLLHTTATAYLGLFREGALVDGETVFVGGAAGGVGSVTVQLAAAAGARVIASAAAADIEWVKTCGADIVFDYHAPDIYHRIAQTTPQGIDLYWDNSGHHDFGRTLPLLNHGARLIVSAGLQASVKIPIGTLYTRDVSLRGFAISNASEADLASAAALINRHLSDDGIKTRIAQRFSLDEAAEAQRLQETHGSGKARGRIVVIPDVTRPE